MKHFRDYLAGRVQHTMDVDSLIERAKEGDVAPLEEAIIEFFKAWLPDGYSQILRLYVFGPSSWKDYGSATLRCKI